MQLVADPPTNQDTLRVLDTLRLGDVRRRFRTLNYENVIVRLDPAGLATLAARPDVVSIQPYLMPTRRDERQGQIVAGALSGNGLTGPGYLSFLAAKGFTQAQFAGSGFAVDVTDSGVDDGTAAPNHFGLYVNGTLPGQSRVVYNRLEGFPLGGGVIQGCDGHGTINAQRTTRRPKKRLFTNCARPRESTMVIATTETTQTSVVASTLGSASCRSRLA